MRFVNIITATAFFNIVLFAVLFSSATILMDNLTTAIAAGVVLGASIPFILGLYCSQRDGITEKAEKFWRVTFLSADMVMIIGIIVMMFASDLRPF